MAAAEAAAAAAEAAAATAAVAAAVVEAAAEATAAEAVAADTAEEVGAALAGAPPAVVAGMTRTRSRVGKATCRQPATGTMRSTSSISSTPLRPRRRCKAALLRKGGRPLDVVTAQGGKLCSVEQLTASRIKWLSSSNASFNPS